MLQDSFGNERLKYQVDALQLPLVPALICDARMRIVKVNKAISELLSYTSRELKGCKLSDICETPDFVVESCLNHHLFCYDIVEYALIRYFTNKKGEVLIGQTHLRGLYDEQKRLEKYILTINKILPNKETRNFSKFLPLKNIDQHREELFESFVQSIGQTLGVSGVMLNQLSSSGQFAKVKVYWESGQIYRDIVFDNTITPGSITIENRHIHFDHRVDKRFYDSTFFKERQYDRYVGLPIWSSRGDCIGYLAILDSKPLPNDEIIRSVLLSMIGQLGIELEKDRYESDFRAIERKYRMVFDHTSDAIVIFDQIRKRIIHHNKRALTVLNRSSEQINQIQSILSISPDQQADGTLSTIAYKKNFEKSFKKGGGTTIRWRFKKPSDAIFDANVNVIPYDELVNNGLWMLIIQTITRPGDDPNVVINKIGDQSFSLREAQLQSELDYQNRKLSSNLMLSAHLNQLLYSIKESLQKLSRNVDQINQRQINRMLKEIDRNIDLDEEWRKFKLHFEEVHPDFFTKLLNQFPNLNPRQLRHCAYIQLGLNSKEAAQLLNVAPKSIEMARYRLKKKFNLAKDDRLSEFIQSI
ncbi:MAG: PAS domain-containing protein [Bacteroidota bacterium]